MVGGGAGLQNPATSSGVYEKAQRDRTGMETLSKLKGVITSGETSGDLRTRRNELYQLMRELQERKKLQQLVSRAGTAVRGAKAVAKELVEHWDRVSTPTGATEEECVAYLKALGVEQRMRKAGRLLFKQLSLDIVHEGLKRLNSNSSPGLDGFSAKFFKRFSETFEPQMYESLKRFLDAGTMPETWTSGVVTMIPKTKAMQTPDSLRPIALQTTRGSPTFSRSSWRMYFSTASRHSKRVSFVTKVSSSMSMGHGLSGMAYVKERRCQWTSELRSPPCLTRWCRRHWVSCAYRSCTSD